MNMLLKKINILKAQKKALDNEIKKTHHRA